MWKFRPRRSGASKSAASAVRTTAVGALLCTLGNLYLLAILVRIVMSWFPMDPGTTMDRVHRGFRRATDPVLEPVRRLIPPIGMIDISPLIVLIGLQILLRVTVCG